MIEAIVVIMAIAQPLEKKPHSSSVDLRCGAYCLYVSLKALDVPVTDYASLEKKLGQPSPLGYSMKQLADVANEYGAKTLAVKTSLEDLERRSQRFACIALLESEGHYVNIYDVTYEGVYLVDPPKKLNVSRDAFTALWSGNALLLSTAPIEPLKPRRSYWLWGILTVSAVTSGIIVFILIKRMRRMRVPSSAFSIIVLLAILLTCGGCAKPTAETLSIPRAALSPSTLDLGVLEQDLAEKAKGTLLLKNIGTSDLVVAGAKSSCGCTIPTMPSNRIRPGESVPIEVSVAPKHESGLHRSVVSITTNDPAVPTVNAVIQWTEQTAIKLEPNALDLRWSDENRPIETKVNVKLSKKLLGQEVAIKSVSPCVTYEWLTPSLDNERDEEDFVTRPLTIRIRPESNPMTQRAELLLTSPDGRHTARLHMYWEKEERFKIAPKAIFRSDVNPSSAMEFQIAIRGSDKDRPRILGIALGDQDLKAQDFEIKMESTTSCLVKVRLRAGTKLGLESRTMRLKLAESSDGIVTIPVTFMIVEKGPDSKAAR